MIAIQHIHPIIVHFPIVFALTLAVVDSVAILRSHNVTGRTYLGNTSTLFAIVAGLSALMAIIFGDIALETAEATGFRSDIAEIHEGLGSTVAIILIGWAIVRAFLWFRNTELPKWSAKLIPVIELGIAGAILATAFYGGQLVYDLGVNVTNL